MHAPGNGPGSSGGLADPAAVRVVAGTAAILVAVVVVAVAVDVAAAATAVAATTRTVGLRTLSPPAPHPPPRPGGAAARLLRNSSIKGAKSSTKSSAPAVGLAIAAINFPLMLRSLLRSSGAVAY